MHAFLKLALRGAITQIPVFMKVIGWEKQKKRRRKKLAKLK